MRILRCPARYERYLVEQIERALLEIERDQQFRADTDERIQKFAGVPDRMIDNRRTGDLAILVGAVESDLKAAS